MGTEKDASGGTNTPTTWFAPPDRAEEQQVLLETDLAAQSPLVRAIQESIEGYLMILNHQRQVLAVNRKLLEDLGLQTPDCLIGSRPGEILSCIHATEGPGGCGTAQACSTCGAVLSILGSQKEGKPYTDECLATVRRDSHTESAEFRVRATPVRVGAYEFTVLVFADISGDKRRQALERTFFHDILNTIGGLQGWSTLLETDPEADAREIASRIVVLSQRLTREIRDQRKLTEAENNSLVVYLEEIPVNQVFESLLPIFEAHDVARLKHLQIQEVDPAEKIVTDSSLLIRVLTNMVKNAFEGSQPGETVRVSFARRDGDPTFCVHNNGFIPDRVALRIFQRSFSTKGGQGRGIGTYSMKLFGERYLGGQVSFETSVEKGTVFSIRLSKNPPGQRM